MENPNRDNLILASDSYKLNHWNQYPRNTEAVYSYFESRAGARYPETVFFGLQDILKRHLVGHAVTRSDIEQASEISRAHLGPGRFNRQGWTHIVQNLAGCLPLRIKAVPEGTPVPTGNVLMTVENTDDESYWLTNAVESLLTHVWYPSTVASLSRDVKKRLAAYLDLTGSPRDGLQFMLHDFGYRGASSHETAAIGGLAHLINFVGTDTLPAILAGLDAYAADLETLAFSVPATEHSVMTSLGREGEYEIVDQLLDEYPDGILSVVADSYDIYRFVQEIGTTYKDRVLARDGVFVVRPDSITAEHPTPESLVVWILENLWLNFGGTVSERRYRVIDPKVRVLWGDGIDPDGIERILALMAENRFAAENIAAFGMGGGLLQKVNRDTQRFAFKSSAQKRDGVWHDVYKEPLDASKTSKKGRLDLIRDDVGGFHTMYEQPGRKDNLLVPVFENGRLLREYTFEEVRANAAL